MSLAIQSQTQKLFNDLVFSKAIERISLSPQKQTRKLRGIPKTPDELHAYIKDNLGLDIPRKSVCEGHNAPFDYVQDSFFDKTQNCIVIANRTGGKTNNSAALEFSEAKWKNFLEVAHLGAILAQADRAYGYVQKWARKFPEIIDRTIKSRTVFNNESLIEILPGTMNAVNGPHPHKVCVDEFELLPWEIFEEAGSMAKSGKGILSSLRLVTTRKKATGNAQLMISEAGDRGFKLYKYCIFEVMEPCTYKKSCSSCPYESHISYTNSGEKKTWPEVCDGKAKRSGGYIPFSDVLEKFKLLSWEIFKAQWLCERPERFDCVFVEFDYDRNTFSNWDHKTEDEGWQYGRGWDFGYDDPAAVSFFQYNLKEGLLVQFDEIIQSGLLIDDLGDKVRKISDKFAPPDKWLDWGDISGKAVSGVDGKSYIGKLENHEIFMRYKSQFCSDGIQAVKKKLRLSNFTGKPEFYLIRGKCKKSIDALEQATWDRIKTPSKQESREKYTHNEHSHPLDGIRYFVNGVFPIKEKKLTFG